MALGLGCRVRVRVRFNPAQLDRGAQQRARHLGARGVRPAEDERAGVHLQHVAPPALAARAARTHTHERRAVGGQALDLVGVRARVRARVGVRVGARARVRVKVKVKVRVSV